MLRRLLSEVNYPHITMLIKEQWSTWLSVQQLLICSAYCGTTIIKWVWVLSRSYSGACEVTLACLPPLLSALFSARLSRAADTNSAHHGYCQTNNSQQSRQPQLSTGCQTKLHESSLYLHCINPCADRFGSPPRVSSPLLLSFWKRAVELRC